MRNLFLLVFVACIATPALAQDTTHAAKLHRQAALPNEKKSHTAHKGLGNMAAPDRKRIEYFKDTIRRERRKFDSSLFTNIKVESTSDYAEDLGKAYQMLSEIPGTIGSFTKLPAIKEYLDEGDSAIDIVKEKMFRSDQSFNVRSLQMINALLDALDKNTGYYSNYLEQYDTALDEIRGDIADFQKDTLMLHLFRDTALKNQFEPQLLQLKGKWRQVDSLVTENGKEINTLKSQASAHSITIGELISRVDMELKTVGTAALGKERRYLWEPEDFDSDYAQNNFKESITNEIQLARIYFSNTYNFRIYLLVLGLVFYYWVWHNFYTLKRLNKLKVIQCFQFKFIKPHPIAVSFIFILSLAPLFDLHAPAIYMESVQLLLMFFLSIILWEQLPRSLFFVWIVFLLLFMALLSIRLLDFPLSMQRWANFTIDTASFLLGLLALFRWRKKLGLWVSLAVGLYILFNLLAVLCNLFGRVTYSQILGYTAVYSFAQTISLGVFVSLVQESFLLQIQTSRIRKNYPEEFEYATISKSVRTFALVLAIILWLIVFVTNLNLFDSINDFLVSIFATNRQVGNFTFTFGGVILFLGIIWLANFLQKYIAYFFGDTGDDASFDDKGQRSRLMVTRLILLIGGFLLAVAASGLAVDRITVILGALGVGIGLGLQGIVNNFVSGVILIFDRPLRIGDTVDIGDKRGRVKEISIRTSTLLTDEGAEVIIPNGDVLSHNIINWTLSNNHVRQALAFTLEKPANIDDLNADEMKKIILKDPNVMEQRDPEIVMNSINSKTIDLRIYFWIKDYNKGMLTAGQVRSEIYQLLDKKGITVL